MTTYEHAVVHIDPSAASSTQAEALKPFGKDGYRIVSSAAPYANMMVVFLEREVPLSAWNWVPHSPEDPLLVTLRDQRTVIEEKQRLIDALEGQINRWRYLLQKGELDRLQVIQEIEETS